jgi:hypothetical protein
MRWTGSGTLLAPTGDGTFRHVSLGKPPESPGQVYDTLALTEDNEITLALKTLGWAMVSPQECRITTELMPAVGDLWEQRLRWQRGAGVRWPPPVGVGTTSTPSIKMHAGWHLFSPEWSPVFHHVVPRC